MATTFVTTIKRFIGTSADVRPTSTDETAVPTGSTLYETDTGRLYLYSDGRWVGQTDAGTAAAEAMVGLLARLLDEVVNLRTTIALATSIDVTE